ncbi:MAG: hypothetical protein PVG51_01865 [Desulfosarcina sp.]|jgi:hypothetical protein
MTAYFRTIKTHCPILVWLTIGLGLSGCTAATERLHPQFPNYRHTMGKMLVWLPEISIYEIMPDGSRLFDPVRSQNARNAAQQAIARQLQKKQFSVLTVEADRMPTSGLNDVIPLFRSVNRSIQLHTIGPQLFPGKKSAFEYHLGPVAEILQAYNADGLILAIGHQTGSDRPAKNWLSIAVVEPGGRIIWYGLQGDHERFNIQNSQGVHALVASTMAHFWEQGS